MKTEHSKHIKRRKRDVMELQCCTIQETHCKSGNAMYRAGCNASASLTSAV